MQPESEEQFEQYLRQFEPLPPGPLPQIRGRSEWNPRALAAIAAVIVAAVGLLLWESRSGRQLIRPGFAAGAAVVHPAAMTQIGGKSIPDLELFGLNGSAVQLSKLRGEVLLVNFWATWCLPCQTEMPWLTQFQERYGSQGFQAVAISMDEDQSQCGPFIEQHGLDKLMVLLGDSHTADRFGGILGLPTSFLIDRDGTIISKHPGLINRDAVEQEINQLLRRPPADQIPAGGGDSPVSIAYLNRVLRDSPANLNAVLSEESRALLPTVQGKTSTLKVLAED